MAFLCPSRLGRNKQRREIHSSILERIHGGVGFDPLVKYEMGRHNAQNPEALRIILHNFTACSPEELTVRQGQKVHILFREGDWAYVVNADKKEGFIPFTACAKIVATAKTVDKKSGSVGSDTSEQRQTDKINNNTYNVKKDRSVLIQHTTHDTFDETFSSDFADDSFLSTDWSNDSHKHQVVIDALKTQCVTQSNKRYDDNRNLIQTYFESTPYEKLPKFLEIFQSLPQEDDNLANEADSKLHDDRHQEENANESSFISDTSTELPDDTYIALFEFRGRHMDDIDVERDDIVAVLDKSDPFWYWIRRKDGSEGYVPSNYIGQMNDPKVTAIIGERQRRGCKSESRSHHVDCRCQDCIPVSPRTDTSSVASSTLTNDKRRPPKPPRTRKNVPKDSVRSNRQQPSSSHHQHSSHRKDRNKQSTIDLDKTKHTSHHLSLEQLPLSNDKQGGLNGESIPSKHKTDSHQSGKRTSRRKAGPNYREYRSQSQRSYTFEESRDYFDAYFCDEPDPNFKSSPEDKANVVNVSEILKHRSASTGGRKDKNRNGNQPKTWMKNGSTDNGRNILNLRQYMQTLPSTPIGNEPTIKLQKHSKTAERNLPNSPDGKHDTNFHGHSKHSDWSFGYPRKIKSSHNSVCSSTQDISKYVNRDESKNQKEIGKCTVKSVGSQTDLNDIGVNVLDDQSDQMFLDLLSATDNLLEVSEKILSTSKVKSNSVESMNDKGGDRRSSSSETDEDVNVKCSNFIMNQVITTDFGQLTNRSETSNALESEVSENCAKNGETECEEDESFSRDSTSSCVSLPAANTANVDDRSNDIQISQAEHDIRNNNSHPANFTTQHSNNVMSENDLGNDKPSKRSERNSKRSDKSSKKSSVTSEADVTNSDTIDFADVRGVTEFVVQFDYDPDEDMAIPIIKNEILHISLDIQEDEQWFWAFSPRLRTYGYVPKQYVKIPLVTII